MQLSREDHSEIIPQECCPHLGLIDDPATYSAYPTQWNACHYVHPVTIPKITHQRSFCLQFNHVHCPIINAQPGQKMPKDIQHQSPWLTRHKKIIIIIGVSLLVMIMLIMILLFTKHWFLQSTGDFPSVQTSPGMINLENQQGTKVVDYAIAPIHTPSPTKIIPSETHIPPTETKEDPILALDTPIGKECQFIIHRVAPGETLQIFADQYNTSVEAITAVNYNLITPLWADWLVIIPVNTRDVSGLPAFEAYLVEDQDVSLRTLAEQLFASLEDMEYYNNVDADHILHHGEWLLIPREKPSP